MPGQDRTGPSGYGARTGRGMGQCGQKNTSTNNQDGYRYGRGRVLKNRSRSFGCRRGQFEINEKQELQNYVDSIDAELKRAKLALDNFKDKKDDEKV